MKYTEFATLVRTNTHTDDQTYTDAEMIIDANTAMDEMSAQIKEVNPDVFG